MSAETETRPQSGEPTEDWPAEGETSAPTGPTDPESLGLDRVAPRWRYVFAEAADGLARNGMMTFAVVVSVAVSLLLLGAALLVSSQVDKATDDWFGKIEVSIFLCDDTRCPAVSDAQLEDLREKLEAMPVVQQVFFESKQEAYEAFREQFAEEQSLLDAVTPDSLPASYRVKLNNPEQFAAIKDRFAAEPGVEEIVDQREVLDDVLRFARVMRLGAFIVSGLQLLAAMVLIANTIRVTAFARREQTAIMKLVGASNWYVRLPFLLEGVIAGLFGGLLPWGLLLWGVPTFASRAAESIRFIPWIGFEEAFALGPWLVLAGVGIAALSSIIAQWRYLDV